METLMSCFWQNCLLILEGLGGAGIIVGIVIGLVKLCLWLEDRGLRWVGHIIIILITLSFIPLLAYLFCLDK